MLTLNDLRQLRGAPEAARLSSHQSTAQTCICNNGLFRLRMNICNASHRINPSFGRLVEFFESQPFSFGPQRCSALFFCFFRCLSAFFCAPLIHSSLSARAMFRSVVCSARALVTLRPAATVTAVATRPAAAAALHSAAPRRSDNDERSNDRSSRGGDRDGDRRGGRGGDRNRDGGNESGDRDRFRRGGGARGLAGGSGKSLRVQLAEEAASQQLLVPSHPVTGTERGRLSKFAELHNIARGMAKDKEQFEQTVNPPKAEAEDDGPDFLFDSQTPPPPSNKKIASQTVYNNSEIPGIEFKAPVHPNSRVAVHGIGVPAVHVVQHQRPRRYFKPKSVQDVPKPMKTYTEGPREMGNKVRRTEAQRERRKGGEAAGLAIDGPFDSLRCGVRTRDRSVIVRTLCQPRLLCRSSHPRCCFVLPCPPLISFRSFARSSVTL